MIVLKNLLVNAGEVRVTGLFDPWVKYVFDDSVITMCFREGLFTLR